MTDALKILFFARLRDDLGTSEESLPLPDGVTTVDDLRRYFAQRGDAWQAAMDMQGLFIAVGQKVVDWDTTLNGTEEVAFFPPVTGG